MLRSIAFFFRSLLLFVMWLASVISMGANAVASTRTTDADPAQLRCIPAEGTVLTFRDFAEKERFLSRDLFSLVKTRHAMTAWMATEKPCIISIETILDVDGAAGIVNSRLKSFRVWYVGIEKDDDVPPKSD